MAASFGSIPHAELLKSLARRISDGAMMHILKSWLCMAVEEEDERGRKHRTTRNRDEGKGTPQGAPISPLLPGSSTCSVLVTSRKRLTGLPAGHRYEVGAFSRRTAMELLTLVAGADRITAEPEAAG